MVKKIPIHAPFSSEFRKYMVFPALISINHIHSALASGGGFLQGFHEKAISTPAPPITRQPMCMRQTEPLCFTRRRPTQPASPVVPPSTAVNASQDIVGIIARWLLFYL